MGYYCTVPQCTSLAGKTKNVKFHRFPRDSTMADKWNGILKRGKPYTKYSKVCSLHFTQSDYNVTTMGQWKTLSKDAVPSQNLPKLHPDGTVMVIRKSRTVKYKDTVVVKKELDLPNSEKVSTWPVAATTPVPAQPHIPASEDDSYQPPLATLTKLPLTPMADHRYSPEMKPKKQDAIMQTDPLGLKDPLPQEQPNNVSTDERSFSSDSMEYSSYVPEQIEKQNYQPKDYSKQPDDYVPQTNEEYNKEAEKYALERKPNFEKNMLDYQKPIIDYQKSTLNLNGYSGGLSGGDYSVVSKGFGRSEGLGYPLGFEEPARNPHMTGLLHHRPDNPAFFTDHIKQEIDLSNEDEKYLYSRNKQIETAQYYEAQVKTEPIAVCDTNGPQTPYYHHAPPNINPGVYYSPSAELARPGPDLLIAKQNALAAHSQLWQNSMKRPFFYTDSAHYNPPILHSRYEFQDLNRILNQ